jgi:hypothetical protein
MLSDYLTKYNSLSNAEKMDVAKFYNANPLFTSDFLNLSNKSTLNGNSDYDCFKVNSRKVVLTTIQVLVFVAYLPTLTAAGPIGSVTAIVGFVSGVYAAVAIISAAHEHLLNDCFRPFESLLKDDSGNTDDFELNNESEYTFSVFSKDRLLNSLDANSSNSILSTTVEKFNLVKSKWNTLKNGVNSIVNSTTNWFTSWFSSSSTTYEAISFDFKNLPSTSTEVETDGDSEFITIEDFPSDIVVEYSVASDNSIKLNFKADESTLPRTVTGKIKYDDGDFSNENEFSVTLNAKSCNLDEIVGTWKVEMYNTCYPNPDGTPANDNQNYTLDLHADGSYIFTYYDGSTVTGTYSAYYSGDGCRISYGLSWCSPAFYTSSSPYYQQLYSCGCLSTKHTKL